MKLNKSVLGRLTAPHPSGKQTLIWDAELKGFGVLLSGTTSARSFVVQRALPGGRTRRVTIGAVAEFEAANKSIEDARTEAGRMLLDLRNGLDPKAARRAAATLREALEDFLVARKTLRRGSAAAYREAIERHLGDWLEISLRDITPEMVERRHAAIQKEIAKREAARRAKAEKRGRTSLQRDDDTAVRRTGHATANGAMVALRAVWNFASDRNPALPPNPVGRLRKAWFPVHRRVRRVRADELPAFHAAVHALPNRTARDYLLMLLFTGMRRSEAASLRWVDVDFPNRLIRLPARHTKSGRRLDLPMSDLVFDLLVARRAIGRDGEFVFPSHSASGHIAEPKFHLSVVAKATGGIYVSAHDLRRTFLDVAEATEMSVYALKALVNHAAGGDVTAGYLGLGTERLREPVQRVADRMKVLCGMAPSDSEKVARLRR